MYGKRKTWISAGLLVIVLLAGVLCGGCFWQPEHISVDVICPLHVAKGEEFVFEVQVENTADSPQLLYSIDIWDEYLEGISIQRTEPSFIDCYHIPIDNTQSFEFKKDIVPKGKLMVSFHAIAIEAGDYSSYLDVCINTATSFLTHPIITIVED